MLITAGPNIKVIKTTSRFREGKWKQGSWDLSKKSIRRSFVVDVDGDGNPFDVGFESSKSGLLVCDNKWPVGGCDCPWET